VSVTKPIQNGTWSVVRWKETAFFDSILPTLYTLQTRLKNTQQKILIHCGPLVVALFEGMGTGLRRVEIKRCHFRQDGCHYFTSTLRAEVADEGENWKLPRITVRNCESNLDPLILPKPLSTRSSDTVLWNDIINLCSNECCRQEMCQLDFSDKPVPNMTYNVFSGTLNRAILQDTIEPNASHCPLFWTSR